MSLWQSHACLYDKWMCQLAATGEVGDGPCEESLVYWPASLTWSSTATQARTSFVIPRPTGALPSDEHLNIASSSNLS
jgi:hypothetical protein